MDNKGQLPIILAAVVLIVIVGGFFLYGGITGNTTKENCEDVKTPYEEQEEYLKTEYYTETVPYDEEVPLKFVSDDSGSSISCSEFGNYKECYYVSITNIDDSGGLFTVNCEFETLNRKLSDSDSLYVGSGELVDFTCEADVDLGEDVKGTYTVDSPTKTVTKYKEVQREKQITAYRPVTKYKTETVCN